MPLKDKYLKYTPEITLDIFTLICNKLIENGIKASQGESIVTKYNNFSKTENCLQLNGNGSCFECYKEDYGLTETTVQEILGYNPFIKDEFVLPEKWCIKLVSEEINNAVNSIKLCRSGKLSWINQDNYTSYYIGFNGEYGTNLIYLGYTEITFDQFKKYVPKEIIPEYVECIIDYPGQFTKDKIYKTIPHIYSKHQYSIEKCDNGRQNGWTKNNFKPSTKEAFDAQNKPKSIEKWSVGSYVVFLCNNLQSNSFSRGDMQKISKLTNSGIIFDNGYGNTTSDNGIASQIKWFATLQEAEIFAKTLVEPVKEEYPLTKDEVIETNPRFKVGKWYYNSDKTFAKASKINTHGFDIDEIILKGIYFKRKDYWGIHSDMREVSLEEIQQYLPDGHPDKIKLNQEFKVGDWVKVIDSKSDFSDIYKAIGYIFQIRSDGHYAEKFFDGYNQAIDPDNKYCINYNKSNVRHATPEEINQHLISIGQIPAGEPLNNGIKPNKDGVFKYTTYAGTIHVSKCSTVSGPLKLILSIDDEELPMVNIIKTKKVNLLNND